MSTHYTSATMTADQMQRYASMAVKHIQALDDKLPVLMYRGMSGVALATATCLWYYYQTGRNPIMVYVRKPHEDSNGGPIECSHQHFDLQLDREELNLFFVDDFIDSGFTYDQVTEAVKGYDEIFALGLDMENNTIYALLNHRCHDDADLDLGDNLEILLCE